MDQNKEIAKEITIKAIEKMHVGNRRTSEQIPSLNEQAAEDVCKLYTKIYKTVSEVTPE